MSHRLEKDQLLCAIQCSSLDEFWIKRPGTIKNNLMALKRIHDMGDEFLELTEGLPNLVPFMMIYEIGTWI